MKTKKIKEEQNFKDLCKLTSNLLNISEDNLYSRVRKKEFQVPRAVAAMVARIEDDCHRETIAKVLKRHRTSVNHYERVHSGFYASMKSYRDAFNKVYNAYSEIKGARKTFYDLFQLKNYLRKKGIKDSSKTQIILRVKSGKVGTDINVSYRHFDDQLEKLKLALKEYDYELEIITV